MMVKMVWAPKETLYFEEIPLKGPTTVDFVKGTAKIDKVKVCSTSYNHKVIMVDIGKKVPSYFAVISRRRSRDRFRDNAQDCFLEVEPSNIYRFSH